jgi:hypothetical protein
VESGFFNQLINFAIQVTATAGALPEGRDSGLPPDYARIARSAMLNKNQPTS